VPASELDDSIGQAVSQAQALYARLFQKADIGTPEGSTDEATRIAAMRRAGLADLPADKLKALVARAR